MHGSEFVVNAEATRGNRALLERINAGANQPSSSVHRIEFSGNLPVKLEGWPEHVRPQVEEVSRAYMEQLARLATAPPSYHGD